MAQRSNRLLSLLHQSQVHSFKYCQLVSAQNVMTGNRQKLFSL